jgi:site-specific DNA-methyltransferase (adenine-specific)
MPGPTSVIEAGLLVGFVGRAEQTGQPAQKPEKVYEPIYLMTAAAGDLVLDPMAGSGTTGSVGARLGFRAILSDISEEYVCKMEDRLGLLRLDLADALEAVAGSQPQEQKRWVGVIPELPPSRPNAKAT